MLNTANNDPGMFTEHVLRQSVAAHRAGKLDK